MSDKITVQEAGTWSAWRLVEALVLREAIETCSIILRAVHPIAEKLDGSSMKGASKAILEDSWSLLSKVDAIYQREIASWVSSAIWAADWDTAGTTSSGLFRHASEAADLLFEESVVKYIKWQSEGPAKVWLGEPILRSLATIRKAIRTSNGLLEGFDAQVAAHGYYRTEDGIASPDELILRQIKAATRSEERKKEEK